MKTISRCFWLLVLAWVPAAAVAADLAETTQWYTDATLRIRAEGYDWLASAPSSAGASPDEREEFFHSKLQLGVRYDSATLSGAFQLQHFQLASLRAETSGPGAVYTAVNDDTDPGDVIVRQAYLRWLHHGAERLNVSFGRMPYANGSETTEKDGDLQALKQQRIFNRIFGTFDYTAGRSFDGVLAKYALESTTFAAGALRPTQGGFATDGQAQIEDIEITTLSASAPLSIAHSNEQQLFHSYYADERGDRVVKADNRPAAVRDADELGIRIHNLGLSSVHVWHDREITFDALLWGVGQIGTWGAQSHRAGAFAVEGGARFDSLCSRPRISAGYNWGSGDSTPDDRMHSTYFQMLPTARQYANLPFYNAMNNRDIFLQLSVEPTGTLQLKSAMHLLRLESRNDALYSGGGANREDQFGFSAAMLGGDDDLGVVTEVGAEWKPLPWWSLSVYYGHLDGGRALRDYRDGNLDFGFLETTLLFTR